MKDKEKAKKKLNHNVNMIAKNLKLIEKAKHKFSQEDFDNIFLILRMKLDASLMKITEEKKDKELEKIPFTLSEDLPHASQSLEE